MIEAEALKNIQIQPPHLLGNAIEWKLRISGIPLIPRLGTEGFNGVDITLVNRL